MRKEIIIDGGRFNDLAGFFDEVERVFTKDLTWRIGRNLDAFNDILRGGFGVHAYGEPIVVKWLHYSKSRNDFGYPATVRYYEQILTKCHPANTAAIEAKIRDAREHTGKTLMDTILEIILDTNDSGHNCTFHPMD